MRRFSVVCPVHNEADYIIMNLYTLHRLYPDEIIYVFDRCTDNSRKLVEYLHEITEHPASLILKEVNYPSDWAFRPAFLRRIGYRLSSNDSILNVAADLVVDSSIRKHINELSDKVKLVQFGFLDYPPSLKGFMRQVYSKLSPWKSYSGLFAFSKRAWIETENQDEVSKIPFAEDSHLIKAIESKYKMRYHTSKSIHLRPTETKSRDERRGVGYAKTLKASPLRVFLTSIAMLRPHMFANYMKERKRG